MPKADTLLALAAAAALAAPPPAAAAPTVVPVDAAMTIDGVDVACTGIGLDARSDPRWLAYGLRIELSNSRNEYLVGGAFSLRDAGGRSLLDVSCDAPWLLLRVPPGSYVVEARTADRQGARSARVSPPKAGQTRVVLQFPD